MKKNQFDKLVYIFIVLCSCLCSCNKNNKDSEESLKDAMNIVYTNAVSTEQESCEIELESALVEETDYGQTDEKYVYWEDAENYIFYSDELHGFINSNGEIYKTYIDEENVYKYMDFNFTVRIYDNRDDGNEEKWGCSAVYPVEKTDSLEYDWYFIDKDLTPVFLYTGLENNSRISFSGTKVIFVKNCEIVKENDYGTILEKGDLYLYDSEKNEFMFIDNDVTDYQISSNGKYILYSKYINSYNEENYFSWIKVAADDLQYKEEVADSLTIKELGEKIEWIISDTGYVYILSEFYVENDWYFIKEIYLSGQLYCVKNKQISALLPQKDGKYTLLANQTLDEFMFYDTYGLFYYFSGMENAKYVPLLECTVYLPISYVKKGIRTNTESLDNVVISGQDGIYIFKSSSQSIEKIADAEKVDIVVSANKDCLIYAEEEDEEGKLYMITEYNGNPISKILNIPLDNGVMATLDLCSIYAISDEEEIEYDDICLLYSGEVYILSDNALYKMDSDMAGKTKVADNIKKLCGNYREMWLICESMDGKGYFCKGNELVELLWYNQQVASVEKYYAEGVGTDAYYEKEEYDMQGRKTAQISYNTLHEINYMVRYEYSNDGRETTEKKYDGTGSLAYEYTYYYDADGKLEKCVRQSNDDNSIKNTEYYEYDSDGKLIKKTTYDEFGNLNGYPTEYSYDEFGNLTEEFVIDSLTGVKKQSKTYTNIYTDGYLSAVIKQYGNSYYKLEYDSQGRLIGEADSDIEGNVKYYYGQWEYSNYSGRMTKYISYGSVNSYRYDSYGNMTGWYQDGELKYAFKNIYEYGEDGSLKEYHYVIYTDVDNQEKMDLDSYTYTTYY